MSLLRERLGASDIETIEKGCPICHSDVKGNDIVLYFCKHCNILYKRDDLVLDRNALDKIVKEKIAAKIDTGELKVEEKIPQKEPSEKNVIILKDLRESKKYYISRKSNVLHVSNCPYGKNIKRENRIVLKTLEGTENLKRCKCMSD